MTFDKHRKVLFIHIPRTGGSSIKTILRLNGFIDGAIHADYKHIKSVLGKSYLKYYKFAFVRNPFSRMVSSYEWIKRSIRKGDRKKRTIVDPGTFENFLFEYKNIYVGKHSSKVNLFKKPQIDFISKEMDFIGKYERLQKDFNFVCDHMMIKRIELPIRKETDEVDYKAYYNKITKRFMYNMFKKDFENFNYDF